MIITFCGHSDFSGDRSQEEKILNFLEQVVGDKRADMYLGGYGGFDNFAYACCKKYQASHPNVCLIFVTPYMSIEYQHTHLVCQQKKFDGIVFPDIEDKPKRFAITYRNRWMVERSNHVVCAVSREWGGAFKTYRYALRKGKPIFNILEG